MTPVVQAQVAPTITNLAFTSVPADGGDAYYLGETIVVTVTFSEAVTVTGVPTLTLDLDMSGADAKPLAEYEGRLGHSGADL